MTRKHFLMMAAQIRAILAGEWTDEPPAWADVDVMLRGLQETDIFAANYVRAVQTAEAYVLLCLADNPRFNQARFLKACGLGT